jgi:TPR repeat protein
MMLVIIMGGNIMANYPGLNDELHLKALIQHITSFVKDRAVPFDTDSAEKLLKLLLRNIGTVDVSGYAFLQERVKPRKRGKNKGNGTVYTPPTVTDLQKVLSGNVTLDKLEQFARLVHVGAYDTLFRQNLGPLVKAMAPFGAEELYDRLFRLCSLRYHTPEEYAHLRHARQTGDDVGFLLALLCHGFDTLGNIPAYYGQRIYEQAQTLDYDSPARYEMMREAADNGVEPACLEYANYIAKREIYSKPLSDREIADFETALRYLLMASNYYPSLWLIAFYLGEDSIPKRFASQINQSLRINTKLKTLDGELVRRQLDTVRPSPHLKNPASVLLAYKIHFYLAFKKESYVKSLNSMSNMLVDGRMVLDVEAAGITPEALSEHYRRIASGGQDIVAISNLGAAWVKRLLAGEEACDVDTPAFQANMQQLEIAARMKLRRGVYYLALAEYHIVTHAADTGAVTPEAARARLLAALEVNRQYTRPARELYYRLGMLESVQNGAARTEYFAKAAELGHPDAIYEVSLRQYLADRQDIVALNSIQANLRQVVKQMTDRKEEAEDLLRQIDRLLQQ